MRSATATVDDYLAELPEHQRTALDKLREQVRAAAPGATEAISYRIPTFKLNGGLVAYSAHPKHCSLHLMSAAVAQTYKADLKPYKTTTATVHFTADNPLPDALVKKLVEARIAENESNSKT